MTDVAAPCIVCSGEGRVRYRKEMACYWECAACGLLYQHPLPAASDMQRFADGEYTGGVYQEYVRARDLKYATFERRLAAVRRYAPGGRLLDVGCACGYLVDVALAAGYDAHGVEFSPAAIAQASARARPRILEGNVDELDLTTLGAFDVVTAFDIVEHSLEPLKFLARLHDLLRVGGWLALTTPDAGHGLRYVMGKRWPMLQPLQHTFVFSQKSLRTALKRAGLEPHAAEPARKCVTIDYLARQIASHNPALHAIYRGMAPLLPAALRRHAFQVNIGEMMVLARRAS